MKKFYNDYEIQNYCCLIDFICQRVAAYNCQRENQIKTMNDQIILFDYYKFLYQKFKKKKSRFVENFDCFDA